MNAKENENMKSLCFVLSVVLVPLCTVAFAQSVVQSDAQKSFTQLKTLAGNWTGPVKLDPPMHEMAGTVTQVSLRVTSRGNALVHEMKEAGTVTDGVAGKANRKA